MRLGEQKNYPMSNDIARWHDDTGWFGVLKKHIPLSIYLSIVQKLNFLREGIHILLHLNFECPIPAHLSPLLLYKHMEQCHLLANPSLPF